MSPKTVGAEVSEIASELSAPYQVILLSPVLFRIATSPTTPGSIVNPSSPAIVLFLRASIKLSANKSVATKLPPFWFILSTN